MEDTTMYYISHSGIKGQRKGVRRFQYANKTYTPAGNERYRPKKGNALATGVVVASSAAYLGALSTTDIGAAIVSSIGALATTPITAISSELVGAGAAVVSGLATIPLSVLAIAVPVGAMATASVIKSGIDYIEELKDD